MTSRPKEPYSLAANVGAVAKGIKTNVAQGIGEGTGVFIHFTPAFIKPDTITNLTSPPDDIPEGMYKDLNAVGFFDSLHDFKSDFFDCQAVIKSNPENYSYKKFGFTFLLQGGYPALIEKLPNLIIQTGYSYLNRQVRPLNQDNLENYFSIGNIYDVISDKSKSKGNVYILPDTKIVKSDSDKIYQSLASIYGAYKDPNFGNKIKLIFDFQLNLFDIIKKGNKDKAYDKKHFCLLYTAETITDPAPKMKFDGICDVFGSDCFYFESLGPAGRTSKSDDAIGGNVDTTFRNIQPNSNKIQKTTAFSVQAKYVIDGYAKKDFETIQMNSKANTIDTIKNIIRNTIERATAVTGDTFQISVFNNYFSKTNNNRKGFYEVFNNDKDPTGKKDEYKKDYSIYYARKRLGDTLQGRICKRDKLSRLSFNRAIDVNKDSGTIVNHGIANPNETTDAVLVTHDRMLFSYAVINQIPVILDLKDNMILYVPPPSSIGGQKNKIIKPKIPKHDYPIYRSIERGNSIKRGGAPILFTDEDDIKQTIDSIMNNVDSLIRFLYFLNDGRTAFSSDKNFEKFIKTINKNLTSDTNRYNYAYLGQYATNTLIITPTKEETDTEIDEITNETNKVNTSLRLGKNLPGYADISMNPRMLTITDNASNYIRVSKYYGTFIKPPQYYLRINFKYGESKSTDYDLEENTIEQKLVGPITTNLTKIITEQTVDLDDDDKVLAMREIYDDISIQVGNQETTDQQAVAVAALGAVVTTKKSASNNTSLSPQTIAILVFILVILAFKYFKMIGGGGDDEIGNNASPYDTILNTSFDKLYDTKNLVEKNMTILYFLFSLLRQYELTFV